MEFNELITADYANLDNEQKEFISLHRTIVANGNAAALYAVEMAKGLKEMRDSNKYKAAGFESFGEYAEAACGIKERQAYNYISFVENLSEEFLQSNAKIGVSKLTLLASMSASDRNDLIAEHGDELEDISTRELDRLKKEYESRIQQMQLDFDELLKEKDDELEKVQSVAETNSDDVSSYISDLQQAEEEKAELLAEIEKLKATPTKVDDKATAELEKKKEEIKKLKEAKLAAEKKIEEERERADKEIAIAIERERAVAKAIEKDLELERARLNAEAKKAKIAVDPMMSDFKARFGLWQQIGNELLELVTNMEDSNAERCKKALMTVIGGWQK